VATGRLLTVPYYPGYRYAAFAAKNIQDVSIYHTAQLHNETFNKVGKVTEYEKRPDSLVYFDHCLHVFDIKVNIKHVC
jgi:hypothetical protein